jgi:hypothetical protein
MIINILYFVTIVLLSGVCIYLCKRRIKMYIDDKEKVKKKQAQPKTLGLKDYFSSL